MPIKKTIVIIGVPVDLGANIRGARFGPKKIRQYLIPWLEDQGIVYTDLGDVPIPTVSKKIVDEKRRHMDELRHICIDFLKIRKCLTDCFLIVLGGDHSIVSCLMYELTRKKTLGIIWFDAHGDFNTPETTPSGNIHGMPLAEITGRTVITLPCSHKKSVDEKNVSMVGVRDLDPEEYQNLAQSDITIFHGQDIHQKGIGQVMRRAAMIAGRGKDGFHVSIDIDCIDPRWAPGVSTPVKGGISRKDMLTAMQLLARDKKLDSIDFVELNPKNDRDDKTAKLVVEIIKTLLR